jgi:hypothetical protein
MIAYQSFLFNEILMFPHPGFFLDFGSHSLLACTPAEKSQYAYSDPIVTFRLFAFEVWASLQLTNITALRL